MKRLLLAPFGGEALVAAVLALAILTTVNTYIHDVVGWCTPITENCFTFHEGPEAVAPWRYRVLPALIEQSIAPGASDATMLIVDAVLHSVFVALLYPLLWTWLKRSMTAHLALVGVLAFALVFNIALQIYTSSLSSIIELNLLLLMLLVLDKPFVWAVVFTCLASLNRETGLLLVGVYAAWHGRKVFRQTAMLVLLWAAITAALHLALGTAPHVLGLLGTFIHNLERLPRTALMNAPFLPLWWLAWHRRIASGGPYKRLLWVAVLYVGSVVVGATWEEVRVLLPLVALVLPVALCTEKGELNYGKQ